MKALIEADPGLQAAEAAITSAIEHWWKAEEHCLDGLHATADLVELRRQLFSTFETALQMIGLLDRFAVTGIVAAWWGASLHDLKALATLGYQGLISAWVATVLDALEEDKAKIDPLEHAVARALLPEYLDGLAMLEADAAEVESTIKAATAGHDEDDESEAEEETLSPAAVKQLKAKLTVVKRKLKADKADFARHLSEASVALSGAEARQIVLDALQRDLLAEAATRVDRHRRFVVAAFEMWWDKYQTPLSTLEAERETAAAKLAGFLKELGYD